jgi:hypothetical protein
MNNRPLVGDVISKFAKSATIGILRLLKVIIKQLENGSRMAVERRSGQGFAERTRRADGFEYGGTFAEMR